MAAGGQVDDPRRSRAAGRNRKCRCGTDCSQKAHGIVRAPTARPRRSRRARRAGRAAVPGQPALVEPFLGLAQRLGIDGAGAHPADLLGGHQPALLEHLQMLHDGRQRHGEAAGPVRSPMPVRGSAVDDLPARRIGQCLEHQIERRRLVKHALKDRRCGRACQFTARCGWRAFRCLPYVVLTPLSLTLRHGSKAT